MGLKDNTWQFWIVLEDPLAYVGEIGNKFEVNGTHFQPHHHLPEAHITACSRCTPNTNIGGRPWAIDEEHNRIAHYIPYSFRKYKAATKIIFPETTQPYLVSIFIKEWIMLSVTLQIMAY